MFIKRLNIKNYKGFSESGWIEFGPGFNVIVGQNNSGKTALLEAIRLNACENKPHKSPKTRKGYPTQPTSNFEFDCTLTRAEVIELFQRTNSRVQTSTHVHDGVISVQTAFASESINFKLATLPASGAFSARGKSSILDFGDASCLSVWISPSQNEKQLDFDLVNFLNPAFDTIPETLLRYITNQFYVFKAERLALAKFHLADESILLPNGANLAAVLAKFFANKPAETAEYHKHVTSIFPSIQWVQSSQVGNEYIIKIWTSPVSEKREDLANTLEDSGTGIGQVLAILYVAMTMPPSVIAIDEPNSFLHPGATKKLLQILKQYEHQYIISTHSTDIISTVEPDSLHLVKWEDGESKVTTLDRSQVKDMRIILNEVGVGLSDVFASDQVIWVEGQTEQECFPVIAKHAKKSIPLGLSFLAVHNTGDFEAKDWTARKIWELYSRLGDANGIMPIATAFSLDKESRTQSEMDDLAKETKGKMHFLPRRAYENYLVHPKAIVEIINTALKNVDPVSVEGVEVWIKDNGKDHHKEKLSPDGDDSKRWFQECDAAKLLGVMFGDLTEARLEYNKTRHSLEITEWILTNEPDFLKELSDYVVSLIPNGTAL